MSKKSKVTFRVDLDKDPDLIFEEIKLWIERELKKKGSGDKNSAFLSKLHEIANEHIKTSFKTTNDLIRALAEFASPKMRDRIFDSSPTGRRKTISMSQELYDQILSLLSKPKSNKADIARKTGVSVVQVRKVAFGGYEKKYGKLKATSAKPKPIAKKAPSGQADLPLSQMERPPVPAKPRPKIQRSVTRPPMRPVVKTPLDL